MRCSRKTTFHYKGKLQVVFRAGLIEIKYDYVDSKQHLYLQYHVATTEHRHEATLQKTKDPSSSGVPRVYRAWGQTQFNDHQSHYSGSCIFGYNSAPAAVREVFKPSTDSASLLVSSQKKIFSLRLGVLLGERHKWGCFRVFMAYFARP